MNTINTATSFQYYAGNIALGEDPTPGHWASNGIFTAEDGTRWIQDASDVIEDGGGVFCLTALSNAFECDCCKTMTPNRDKWHQLRKRPSCPEEIVSVMWGCPKCGEKHGLSGPDVIAAIDQEFDDKGYAEFYGTKCLWLSL